ncbi:hypothetical protein MAR_ORF364 [Marseillevirus marseillevirus]|uniref:Uncharacterized protein n=1 Tax=Marseillevirus marseillevirus TaxID=694581 RepID=D2XB03_GBMV|nr:hypothetical protein MAR_ORF364 [Marseillevirus marseillevirus]ADB04130.1 hypothetical protein MAR_ORF364 [Marseillevirus marseillevirus]AVR53081.1 hypothetical protein MarSH_376 [Marseillevirus Shanghai 1]
MEKVSKVRELLDFIELYQEEIRKKKAEILLLKNELFLEMDKKGKNSLSHEGKIFVSRSERTTKSVDSKKMILENPELAKRYEKSKKSWVVNWRRPRR